MLTAWSGGAHGAKFRDLGKVHGHDVWFVVLAKDDKPEKYTEFYVLTKTDTVSQNHGIPCLSLQSPTCSGERERERERHGRRLRPRHQGVAEGSDSIIREAAGGSDSIIREVAGGSDGECVQATCVQEILA